MQGIIQGRLFQRIISAFLYNAKRRRAGDNRGCYGRTRKWTTVFPLLTEVLSR